MATYSLSNFLGTVSNTDVNIKIYDKTKKLRYEINPNIAYFLTKSNNVIIRIEDSNNIFLDFDTIQDAAIAASRLNDAKKKLEARNSPDIESGFTTNDQRKLAYFHALSKSMTKSSQTLDESKYKSSHNVRLNEVWANEIPFAEDFTTAYNESLTNNAITYFNNVQLIEIPNSNKQAYCLITGGTFDINGNIEPDASFIRPWISPVDVPNTLTREPSNGYKLKLYRGMDSSIRPGEEISPNEGGWNVEYYAGIVHFSEGKTPIDIGLGTITASFFQYTGLYANSLLTDSYHSVRFDEITSELIFNEGESGETVVDLTDLSKSGTLSYDNTNMDVETTTSGSTLACNIPLVNNLENSKVHVYINGIQITVGNKSTDMAYFSPNGIIVRESGSEIGGDKLYWRYISGLPVAEYELENGVDKITFLNLNPS